MKLVIDLRLINTSGIGTYLKNVVPGILDSFEKVIVLGISSEIRMFAWSSRVKIIEFNAKIYSPKEQLLYPFVIPKCDVFWSPLFNVPLLPIRAKKIVSTIHDANQLAGIVSFSAVKKKYARILFQNAASKSNFIFTVSEFSKSEIIKYTKVSSEKISVVYCGVDTNFFRKSTLSASFYLPKNYILYVGNVKPHKNLIVLLKAYNLLPKELKSKFKVLIIGKKEGFITGDSEVDLFIEKYQLQNNISFTGYVQEEDLPTIYQNAALFVFPSLYEGFGLPVLEALAAQTLVISSYAASLPEVGGEAVIYFNPNDEIELCEKIRSAIENPKKNELFLAKASVQLEKYTWEKSIQKHLRVFKTL